MARPLSQVLTLLLATAEAIPTIPLKARQSVQSKVDWQPCPRNTTFSTASILCGNLTVPLDYESSNSTATLRLDLRKIAATKGPSRGSILINYGGPGDDGDAGFSSLGPAQSVLTGGEYDLINWTPRGTGSPVTFDCYGSSIVRTIAQLSNVISSESSDVALGQLWAYGQTVADACYATQNATGDLIGTAYVARDMMQIVDALDSDRLLRYWGISYGSVLGATVAAMFPDRMDKIVLDGVVNSHEYYHGPTLQAFEDTESLFEGFCNGCVAAPENCSLAANHTTGASLQAAIKDFVSDIRSNPLVLNAAGSDFILGYGTVKTLLYGSLYAPQLWTLYSSVLAGLLAGERTVPSVLLAALSTSNGLNEAEQGILCGDKEWIKNDLPAVESALEGLHNQSYWGDIGDSVATTCARWRFAAKDRYEGNFCVKTKSPILLIGNTYDPVTPIVGARNMSAGFEGSVVLQQDGCGHASVVQGSLCTARALRAYFTNGTLPEPGTLCKVDTPLFSSDDPLAAIVKQLATEDNTTVTIPPKRMRLRHRML